MTDESPDTTIGEKLLRLKARSGLSLAQIASAAGYRSASAIQRFFNKEYAPTQPTGMVGRRLAAALRGHGSPSIEEAEVLSLFDVQPARVEASLQTGGGWSSRSGRIPVTAATWVSDGISYEGLEFLDVFTRSATDLFIEAPAYLKGTALGGFYVPVSNMWPKYEVGEFVVFEGSRPVRAGDYAISRLDLRHGEDTLFFIAKVVKIDRDKVTYTQFNPECVFDVPGEMITFMARMVGVEELLPSLEQKVV